MLPYRTTEALEPRANNPQVLRCMQELQSTYEALQQSRLACEERDYVIATHERSEAALASHASALTAELEHAAVSMSNLFNRYESASLYFCRHHPDSGAHAIH